ncbi:helix-turn-helix domain-containing protein [Solidesulfovibrio carbinolicus]|uniref:HTH cro/C1-type domain-containing protein n=1 Tax=Solidesulfovibrio carbinolicus TaxID=296842 RepID=A0A4P6HM34_9BACT|nr:helix-turn-helix transcriptional regulator [Solidesulfovibrio carbinolicus]QAZ68267.1 hypothetical protein C3Y92_13965 [Solidesulfovibrio carbinolicus]
MKIAEKIVTLRGKESRTSFAAKIGINANTLRNYETGLSLPNSDVLSKICAITGVDAGWLLLDGIDTNSLASVSGRQERIMIDIDDVETARETDQETDEEVLKLPPTSTISDNRELLAQINKLRDDIENMYKTGSFRYKSCIDYIRIKDAFAIPIDAKYASFGGWPEAMGYVLLEYLSIRIKTIEKDGLDSWNKIIVMIPADEELNKREREIFRKFKLTPTSKDVVAWFSNFFGKDTKLKRSRFCRFAFVAYAEDYLGQLPRDFTNSTGKQ